MEFTIEHTVAALLEIEVIFDDAEITEWCPATNTKVSVVLLDYEAEEAMSVIDDLIEEAVENQGLLRRDPENIYTNILKWNIVGGYIGESAEAIEVALEAGYDNQALELLEALWGDGDIPYEAILAYATNDHYKYFDRDTMENYCIGQFSRDIEFMHHMVNECNYPVEWIEENFDESDFRHDCSKYELSGGGAVYFHDH